MSENLLEEFQKNHKVTMYDDEIETIVATIRNMPDDGVMVEWGSGASTLRWVQEMRSNQRLISIEHNPIWYARVKDVIDSDDELSSRVAYHLCLTNGYYDHGYGGLNEENPVGLDTYFSPDNNMYNADVFLIDGVARGVCAQMVLMKAIKFNPIIYMHDWHPRALWYSWSVGLFKTHEKVGTTLCQLTLP